MRHRSLSAITFFFCFFLTITGVQSEAKVEDTSSTANANLLAELTGKDISKENDIELYAQMLSSYQKDDEIGLKSRLQSLLSRFPNSPYADNALYLAGRRAADAKDFADAIKYFSLIEQDYPKSNKVVAAKFAKAMTYRSMNLQEISLKLLKEVRRSYAGSPESFRANAELKILKKDL